jgi:DNA-binding transcriptional regulator YdaS (Cro superfamily)
VNIFKTWMKAATPGEQSILAEALDTSREYLYQLSGGFRKASPERGAAIEAASARMHEASQGRLPRIYRTDMVEACRNCEFAQRCLGPAATRSEFEEVTVAQMADTEGGSHD